MISKVANILRLKYNVSNSTILVFYHQGYIEKVGDCKICLMLDDTKRERKREKCWNNNDVDILFIENNQLKLLVSVKVNYRLSWYIYRKLLPIFN